MNRDLLGYHGTSIENADKIVASQSFNLDSARNDHWLGQGAYFFHEDHKQAQFWGEYKFSRSSVAIIEAKVSACRQQILDLNTREGVEFLNTVLDTLAVEHKVQILHSELLDESPKIACFVFSSISNKEKWVIIKTFPIKSFFDKNEKLRQLAFKHNGKQIEYSLFSTQICVKNHNAIERGSIKLSANEYSIKKTKIKVEVESVPDDLFN